MKSVVSIFSLFWVLLFSSCRIEAAVQVPEPVREDLKALAEAPGGVGLDRSRIVIKGGARDGSIGVRSQQPTDVLVSAYVEDINSKASDAFTISPSVYRLKPMTENRLRIVQLKPLPQDVESVFYVTVNCVPSIPSKETNKLAVIVSQRVKLFYRPKGLFGDSVYAASELKWDLKGDQLTAFNPTKLSVSAAWISFGSDELDIRDLILPGKRATWTISKKNLNVRSFKFTYVDEYGGKRTYEVRLKPN